MGFMYFTRGGSLAYSIRLEGGAGGEGQGVTAISMDNGKRSRRLLTVIPGLERSVRYTGRCII